MQQIKNIIFDLGGVLLDIDYNKTKIAFEALGVNRFDELYSQADASDIFRRLEKGTIPVAEFYNELRNITGLSLSDHQIETAWNSMLLDFREKSLQYLERLKPYYALYLLSNTNKIHTSVLQEIYYSKPRKAPFEQYFTSCIYSYDTGTRKPDRECFEWVLKKENLDPGHTIFIDDSIQNVHGAESAGIKGIWLKQHMMIEDLGLLPAN